MNKDKVNNIIASFLVVSGIGLLFTAILLQPQGVIDSSVLYATGQIFTLVGALLGVKTYVDSRVKTKE